MADTNAEIAHLRKTNARQSDWIIHLRHEGRCHENDKRILEQRIADLEAEKAEMQERLYRQECNISFMQKHYVPRSAIRKAGKMKFMGFGMGNQVKGFNTARD